MGGAHTPPSSCSDQAPVRGVGPTTTNPKVRGEGGNGHTRDTQRCKRTWSYAHHPNSRVSPHTRKQKAALRRGCSLYGADAGEQEQRERDADTSSDNNEDRHILEVERPVTVLRLRGGQAQKKKTMKKTVGRARVATRETATTGAASTGVRWHHAAMHHAERKARTGKLSRPLGNGSS